MFGLKHFRMYLYGRHFTIQTIAENLWTSHCYSSTSSPTLAEALILSAFDYDIQFVTSKQNAVADALSRLPLTITDSTEGIFMLRQNVWRVCQ